MANVYRTSTTGFNDPSIKLNILSGETGAYKPVYKLKAGIDNTTIKRGVWVVGDSNGELSLAANAAGVASAMLCLEPGDCGPAVAFPFAANGTAANGHVAVMFGAFRAEVGSIGYDNTKAYNFGDALKVGADGRLTPVTDADDVVTAYAEYVNASGQLTFRTHGGR